MIKENLIGRCIVAHARHLPRNFHMRLFGLDRETIVVDLPQHDGLRELANYGELVTDITIRGVEVSGQVNVGNAMMIGDDISVADARHGVPFNKKVPGRVVAGVKRAHQRSHSFRFFLLLSEYPRNGQRMPFSRKAGLVGALG